MRKLLTISVCFCSLFLIAAIGDRFSITDLRIDGDGNWIGDATLTGTKTIDGLGIAKESSEVVIDTATTITITDRYMILDTTGTAATITSSADPFISTITYSQGTVVTLCCSSGTIILGDNGSQAGSRLSLGGATRTLNGKDNLTLYLRNDYWEEISFTDNQ